MRRSTNNKLVKKHSESTRDAMEEMRDIEASPNSVNSTIKYMEPNRERAIGDSNRTGRHFDEEVKAGEEDE